jgi:TolB protein
MKPYNLISRIAIVLVLVFLSASAARAQARGAQAENHAVFVSQRNGASELYLLDLNTRQVSQLTATGRAHLAAAIAPATRTIVYAAREGASYELFCGKVSTAWRTRRPQITALNRLTINTMEEYSPSVTSDGAVMAFSSGAGIETMNLGDRTRRVAIPSGESHNDFNPVIAPDGSRIAFVSNRSGRLEIWLHETATGAVRKLTEGASVAGGLAWSADSRQLAFTTTATASKLSGIALASVESGAFRVLTDGNDFSASLSARGDRILFTSMRDGDADLYLLDVQSGGVTRLTHSAGADDGAVFLPEPIRPSRQTR